MGIDTENKWINPCHGMELTPDWIPGVRGNENGILFLCEYYLLKDQLGLLLPADITTFNDLCDRLQTRTSQGAGVYRGLFDRGAGESLTIPKDQLRNVSHDNLTGIACFSSLFNLRYSADIFERGSHNFWRFDNVTPENPSWTCIQHPRDIIFWTRLGGKSFDRFLAWTMMWAFYLDQIIEVLGYKEYRPQLIDRIKAFLKSRKLSDLRYTTSLPETSGKLLAFVRLYTISKKTLVGKVVWKLVQKLVGSQWGGSYKGVFEYYFINPEHPIRLTAEKVFK